MAGRKPLPTNLKLLKGTAQKCRTNKFEPKPDLSVPSAPEHIQGYAREEWGRITDELSRMGLLTLADRAALAAYCDCYATWKTACEYLAVHGLLATTTNGNNIQSPMVGIKHTSLSLMLKFLVEFGLSPSSRSRVQVQEKPKASEWDEVGN